MRTYDDAFSGQRIYPGKVRKDLIDSVCLLYWTGMDWRKRSEEMRWGMTTTMNHTILHNHDLRPTCLFLLGQKEKG